MSELDNIDHLQQWVGKTETNVDLVTAVPVVGLSATLDQPHQAIQPGHRLPELWHWMYFLPMARQSDIGTHGHPKLGGFLPPVSLPRRMWAGSQFEFHQPIYVGDTIERVSTVEKVTPKIGKTGELVFVRVKHQIDCIGHTRTHAITEYHDIVYRSAPQPDDAPPASKKAPHSADWEQRINADDVLLFRYSALTFNGHRIHYDRPYAVDEEGYPGLVVHGPLIATLLLHALREALDDPMLTHYEFKAIKPVFDINPFYVCGAVDGRQVKLWTKDHLGDITMEAVATLAE